MSGHSKWATIKHKKGLADANRSKIFQKLNKEIYVAAKSGDKDPDNNPALRMIVDKAKAQNMPKDRIQAAIDKAHSTSAGEDYEFVRYEGYGPHGVALMIDTLTDNRNRTASDVRSTLTKRGGKLGTDGSVSYLFERKGIIVLPRTLDEDFVMNIALENDAIDFQVDDDSYEITTSYEGFIPMNNALKENNIETFLMNEVRFIPTMTVSLSDEQKEKMETLIETLEDLDDVQNVYHNMEE